MKTESLPPVSRQVRVLINPNSGLGVSLRSLLTRFAEVWDVDGCVLTHQISKSAEDGRLKARRAVADGVDVLIAVGGDGMINTIGGELLGSDVALGVIPTGSGNGFARHFDIPLIPGRAIERLAEATPRRIDVGTANGRPFFVTCSLAWDAALVRSFEKSPVRGILPYVLAGAYGLFEYRPETFDIRIDGGEIQRIDDPMLFTAANLTQFGGGAQIAPRALADDGRLWLTWALQKDIPRLLPNLHKLFDGSIDQIPEIQLRPLRSLDVIRESPQPIQVDGELMDCGPEVQIRIREKALRVLVPN